MVALACRAPPSQDPGSDKVTDAVSPSQGVGMSDGGPLEITARQAQLAGVTIAIATRAAPERTIHAFAEVVPETAFSPSSRLFHSLPLTPEDSAVPGS